MGVGRIFPGRAIGSFSKIFLGGPKVAKFVFSHSKLRKQPFLLKFSKYRGPWPLAPPSDAHVCRRNVVNIHKPLTALPGWDKLSSDS